MNFEPQKVSATSAFLWMKEGLELSIRQFLMFFVMTMVFCGSFYLPPVFSHLMLFFIPTILGIGCIIAECADKSLNLIDALDKKSGHIWFNLFAVGIVPWLIPIALALISNALGIEGDNFSPQDPGATAFDGGAALLGLMIFWFLIAGYWVWFIVPLISVAEAPLALSIDQAIHALSLNKFVILIVLVFALSGIIGFLSPILIFPWLALASSMMYVSYRHIWLGKGENELVKTSNVEQVVAS